MDNCDVKEDNTEIKQNYVKENFEIKGYGYRHQQCLLLLLCFTVANSLRSCMGVALVAMVQTEPSTNSNETVLINVTHTYMDYKNDVGAPITINATAYEDNNTDTRNEFRTSGFLNSLLLTPPYPTLQWNKTTQDLILSSFQFGYLTLQIPGGHLAHRFGARILLAGAMIINCIVSFCIPWAAYYGGSICMVLCRVLQGLSQACIAPGLYTFFGKWAPLEERARLIGFALGGQALGMVLGMPITGFIAASSMGWPGIFRFYGLLSGMVGIFLYYMLADTPSQHPKISMAERRYIEEALGQKSGEKTFPVPWSRILRCKAQYAIILAHVGQTWGHITLYSEVPAFMDKIMGVNIKANGVLTALPFFVMWFTNFFFGWLTDMIIVKKIVSVTVARKIATTLGFIPAAIGLIVLAYAPKDIYVVEAILIVICALKTAANVGFYVNHVDLSPNFAGTLMSISNFVSNVGGAMAPLVASFIVASDVSDEHLWRRVFFVTAGMYVVTHIVYVMLGSSELADWNTPQDHIRRDSEKGPESYPMITDSKEKK